MSTLGQLDRLKINGYKSIKKVNIEFNNINILIGANGVGKSNFIGFFNFIRKLSQKDLELFVATQGGANKLLHFGRRITQELDFYILFKQNGDNLASFLHFIKNHYSKNYTKIIKTIQRVIPYFKDFYLEPEVANESSIRLKWQYKGKDNIFDINDLSDGSVRFICLTTLLLQPNLPTTILLDEPELGLYPYALEVLASIFRVVSNKTQIIASTQSATFADMFEIKDIIVVDTVDDATTLTRFKEDKFKEWLDDYSVGELWQKNIIGGNSS